MMHTVFSVSQRLTLKVVSSQENKEWKMLETPLSKGQTIAIKRSAKTKLMVSFAQNRASKDAYNRTRGLQRLEKQIKAGRLTKAHINNRGYNKLPENGKGGQY